MLHSQDLRLGKGRTWLGTILPICFTFDRLVSMPWSGRGGTGRGEAGIMFLPILFFGGLERNEGRAGSEVAYPPIPTAEAIVYPMI
jgi:hypothetical protein